MVSYADALTDCVRSGVLKNGEMAFLSNVSLFQDTAPRRKVKWQVYGVLTFGATNSRLYFSAMGIGVSSIKKQCTNSESQCEKVIHKKSVGKAGNSNFLNFPLSPLIFYVLLSRVDFQSSSVAFLSDLE